MSNRNEIVNRMQTVPNHETNLDFVRAVAVLMVVGSHLAWFFGNVHLSFFQPALFGRLGVIIFFCHSGIVNMLSIERHVDKHGEHHLFRAFMTRRCFRIYPLSMFVVTVVFLTKLPVSHLDSFATTIGQYAGAEFIPSLLLVQNFVRFPQILGPLWSLPYEIQIYCLFPVIYLALRRVTSAKSLVFGWAILAAVDHALAPHIAKHADVGRFATIPDLLLYFVLFLSGLYAYKEMQKSRRVVRFWALPTLLAALCFLWLLSYDNTKWIFISFCLGSALPHIQSCKIDRVNRACGWVAKYSYGIYLLHDPAIWLGFVRFGHFPIVAQGSIFLIATFGGSMLVYHALEHPMILVGNKAAAAISRKKVSVKVQAAALAG
jgi:peptidoglycan/LPS O-acetylase OafA/YrhL